MYQRSASVSIPRRREINLQSWITNIIQATTLGTYFMIFESWGRIYLWGNWRVWRKTSRTTRNNVAFQKPNTYRSVWRGFRSVIPHHEACRVALRRRSCVESQCCAQYWQRVRCHFMMVQKGHNWEIANNQRVALHIRVRQQNALQNCVRCSKYVCGNLIRLVVILRNVSVLFGAGMTILRPHNFRASPRIRRQISQQFRGGVRDIHDAWSTWGNRGPGSSRGYFFCC